MPSELQTLRFSASHCRVCYFLVLVSFEVSEASHKDNAWQPCSGVCSMDSMSGFLGTI